MSDRSKLDDFWREKSLEELAREQGLELADDLEKMVGSGKALWSSDEQLEEFLALIDNKEPATTAR